MKNSTLLADKEKDVSISDREVEDNCCTIFQSRIICLHFRPKWSFYFRNFTVCAPSSLSLDSDRCRMLVHFVNEIESMFCVTLLPKWIQEFRSVLHWTLDYCWFHFSESFFRTEASPMERKRPRAGPEPEPDHRRLRSQSRSWRVDIRVSAWGFLIF